MDDDYCSYSGHYCGDDDWTGATLRRLPVWGVEVSEDDDDNSGSDSDINNNINFEWPTQEDWATMSHDAKLDSLELKMVEHNLPALGSVKVNLSNG